MRVTVHPTRIAGTLVSPPSKSVMLRVAAAALLAGRDRTRIRNPSLCEDARSGLRVIAALGAAVAVGPDEVVIDGGFRPRERVLDCGESGLCLRMFTAIAALAHREITLTGKDALLRRPATAVEGALRALGGEVRTRDGHAPIDVCGPLTGGVAEVDGTVSSQFLTGLLMATPLLPEDSTLFVKRLTSRPYVNLTLDLLDRFGIRVERDGYERFHVPGGQRYRTGECRIEGDWSAAAFLFVLGAIGGRVRVHGLDPDSAQADRSILGALREAGARVVSLPDGAEVERAELRAFRFDLTDSPDLLPPLAALACHCEGTSLIGGAGRLRHKESDRGGALARELNGLGGKVAVHDDTIEITGAPMAGGRAGAHGDHRVAMALAVAAVGAGGPVSIEGAEHVKKSYPSFFEDLVAVGGEVSG